MKKITFIFISFLIFNHIASSQAILNSGFENWSTVDVFEEPDGYFTSNFQSYFSMGIVNVEKISESYSGSYAARLTSITNGVDTLGGGMYIMDVSGGGLNGGIPYDDRPDSLGAYLQFDIEPNDTAAIIVFFKKLGNPLGYGSMTLTGSETGYTLHKSPITWLIPMVTPDSMIVIVSSSNINSSPLAGSTVTIDNLHFFGSGTYAEFPNGDFENWTTVSYSDPENWTSLNQYSHITGQTSVTSSTDSYEGTYSARIETIELFDDTLGILTNGVLGADGVMGGMPCIQNPQTISGYYKYEPVGADSAMLACMSFFESVMLDSMLVKLPAAADWTYFELTMNYNDEIIIADTVNISFASSNMEDSTSYTGLGSVLYVDGLNITYYPLSIETNNESQEISVYPNPSKTFVNISIPGSERADVIIINSQGKTISQKHTESGYISINTADFNPGFYFIQINTKTSRSIHKIVVE
ncbi:MAG: hypothetical protein A2W91_13830 [Bacteroidetes bacterium GWF2_38_335]|nr:MAG: hypothetical protein A2W91_13830 [Bacteroidetes bacterium GWF2_38_335]OFY77796.1 MAG: hypothetical protein A2281_15520 [Bacteroidetes bacterium RIFOXYA12_FULL_38_20]HBS87399.1 hypothetical protein [Bacteroidales bacterium]